MGAKHAGIHLRCDDSEGVLARLREEFSEKKGCAQKDMRGLEMIRTFVGRNIREIEDSAERAKKEEAFSAILGRTMNAMGAGEPAVIVVREHFVSIYWYDHIRNDNLYETMTEYALLCDVSALGVAVYDDTNFLICAVCNAGKPDARSYLGEYYFDYDDIAPVKAGDICDAVNAPFFLEGLQKVLACRDGKTMAVAFEQETGLPVLMFDEDCSEAGMKELYRWGGAVVYCEN